MRLPKILVLSMPSPQGAWYMTSTALPSNDAAALVKARNEIQRGFVEGTRLGIPVSFIIETLHSGGLDARPAPQPRLSGWLLHSFKTPLVNPGSRYRGGHRTFKRAACGPRQQEGRGACNAAQNNFAQARCWIDAS